MPQTDTAHVALPAGLRLAGQRDGRRVPRVAFRAASDGAVAVGLADPVAAEATGLGRRRAFQTGQRVGGTVDRAGMVPLPEGELLGRHPARAADGGPRRQGVPAARELLVLRAVAAPAVQGRDVPREAEVVVVVRLLPVVRLVAVVAGDVGAAVLTALELVDDRRGLLPVALRAPPGRPHQLRQRLSDLRPRPRLVDQQRRQQQRGADGDGDEDRPEGHLIAAGRHIRPPPPSYGLFAGGA